MKGLAKECQRVNVRTGEVACTPELFTTFDDLSVKGLNYEGKLRLRNVFGRFGVTQRP